MLLIDRTPVTTTYMAVTLERLAEHLRIDDTMLAGAIPYAQAASREVEQYTGLALLSQDIEAISDPFPGPELHLPVGPVAADTVVTVELLEGDGTLTPVPDGFWLQSGRYPVLHFTTQPGGRLKVSYRAGYGGQGDIPEDLVQAVCDQALRLYDLRGADDAPAGLAPATARICARYRKVAL